MAVPGPVVELVERFGRNRDAYLSGAYNETQLRREFVDPFFEILGWDVFNKQGYAEAYKDVIHEDAIKVGGFTKAPDYCFRIGGSRKFFVEAKKPSVNLKDDISPAFQLRRYAWSAKLPLSILSDFEELAVYDCRVKPVKTDKASTARVLYLTYEQYEDKWGDIAAIFARDSILKGSFDKYVESTKGKKGTAEVDMAFLKEIETWRDLLARNLALRNPSLSQRELNYAVQALIDRIIFLRICEDRGIEDYGRLMALLSGTDAYRRMFELFQRADERYNSGLFHFRDEKARHEPPDLLTPGLTIDDKQLKDIVKNLYYPDSAYEFSVLPADILGQVYEQFLGKVIRLTAGHRAVVEDKPEVKRAGGVYYTPTYIVDYIVKNTIGELLKGKTPKQVAKLKILDPACGSGSFLIGAYQYLLDWHRDWYVEHGTSKHTKEVYQGPAGEWRPTTAERKRILINSIYGVDIDPQAVEVTKLSLLLKVLEGESDETLSKQLKLFHERALPDLSNNIKCGNSLVGPDFYGDQQLNLLDDEERYRINAFDWNAEFAAIMNGGGFDAVIGNPPYGMVEVSNLKRYFEASFKTLEGRFDNYELFIEKGISLCGKRALFGYIVPSPLLSNVYARKLRRYLLQSCEIKEITNFGIDVFRDPTIHTCIVILLVDNNASKRLNNEVKIRKQVKRINELDQDFDYELRQEHLGENAETTFDIFVDPSINDLISKLHSKADLLGDVCYIRQCIKTGNDKEYVSSFTKAPGEPWKPTLRGKSIARYSTMETDLYVKYGPWLARNWKNKSFYETQKIAVRETGKRITAVIDLDNRYFLSSLYSVYKKEPDGPGFHYYLLGILNSKIATFYMKMIALNLTAGAFTKIRTNQLERFPLRLIDMSIPTEKNSYEELIELVQLILKLNTQIDRVKTPIERTTIERRIEGTDRQIDQLVFKLYGLTDDEIQIVEQ